MTAKALIACVQAHLVMMDDAAQGERQEALDSDNSRAVGFAEGAEAAIGEIDRLLTTLTHFTSDELSAAGRELDLAPGGK